MSFQAMTWAVDQKCESAGQKLVLIMLANYCNSHTGQCNPSHQRLADECSMGVSTLKGHIARLAEIGVLRIERIVQHGVNLPNQYWLMLGGVGQNLAGGGSDSDPGVGQNLATNLEIQPVIEPKAKDAGKPATRTRKKSDATLIADWMSAMKSQGEKMIPAEDPIWNDGIPKPFLHLAWKVFAEDMNTKAKKAKNWRAQFRTYVRKDYLKLWAMNREGQHYLTTAGKQAAIRFDMKELMDE